MSENVRFDHGQPPKGKLNDPNEENVKAGVAYHIPFVCYPWDAERAVCPTADRGEDSENPTLLTCSLDCYQ